MLSSCTAIRIPRLCKELVLRRGSDFIKHNRDTETRINSALHQVLFAIMFSLFDFKKKKADKLHELGEQLSDQGREDEALEKYQQAIRLDPKKSESYYNIGLIHKYRNNWQASLHYNRIAYELNREDEAARWNLAIAATALRDWPTARNAWLDGGIPLDEGDGPINGDFGLTPVRLNPDGNAEVVWARRIDPVRAEIVSVPLSESGHCAGDVVLHDGAATGYRKYGESERPVFNVLELFEASPLSTFKAVIRVAEATDVELLLAQLEAKGMVTEDWATNYRVLCKACSEGRPHEHEHHEKETVWDPEHEIGIAAHSLSEITAVMEDWTMPTRRELLSLECLFTRADTA